MSKNHYLGFLEVLHELLPLSELQLNRRNRLRKEIHLGEARRSRKARHGHIEASVVPLPAYRATSTDVKRGRSSRSVAHLSPPPGF